MEKIKATKKIYGIPGSDLSVGGRATIYCTDGNVIWTSQVEALRNHTETGVEIETLNTIYLLTFEDKFELPYAV